MARSPGFWLTAVAGVVLSAALAHAQVVDVLYVGDGATNTIKSFDALTGAKLGESDGQAISGLTGPRGIIRDGGELLVVNQNAGLDISGEVLRFSAATGMFLGARVAAGDPSAPFAPNGIVLGGDDDIFVANMLRKSNTGPVGRVNRYDADDGTFLGEAKVKNNEHHPRGVVFGPDGRLYATTRDFTKGLGGTVLRFSADGKSEVFIDDKGGFGQLNRPDGLVFGPDGRLYVISFRAAAGDTDSIRIYSGAGEFLDKIDLHNGTTDPRVFAQSLLFGPGGKLYVPLSTSPDPSVSIGAVRRYDLVAGTYDELVSFASGDLLQPVYMTFGNTDPSTLEYAP